MKLCFVQHLANRGTDAIPGHTYRIDLYVDDERVSHNYSTRRLRPGGSSTYSMSEGYYHFKPTEPGTYTYRWVLDKEDNLPETDETNNVIEGDHRRGRALGRARQSPSGPVRSA